MLKNLKINWAIFLVGIATSPSLFAQCFADYKMLIGALNSPEQAITPITKDFFIEEQFLDEFGNIKDRNRLEDIPDKYAYEGRLYPNLNQQKTNNVEMKDRLSVAIDIRNVSERVGDEYKSNYWFWQEKGCWYLKQKTVHLVYVEPPKPDAEANANDTKEVSKSDDNAEKTVE